MIYGRAVSLYMYFIVLNHCTKHTDTVALNIEGVIWQKIYVYWFKWKANTVLYYSSFIKKNPSYILSQKKGTLKLGFFGPFLLRILLQENPPGCCVEPFQKLVSKSVFLVHLPISIGTVQYSYTVYLDPSTPVERTVQYIIFRSQYTCAEDSTVEEVMFWEGEPRGPSKLIYQGNITPLDLPTQRSK